ncbi:winged helix DNA-binding domain-containing protein [Virgisporangium aliadipatigenens]|uniref:winged helix DNA-binding domain-containing protein n=1 Tax=Virgisporangium aliadipatigenens TaxID=741659 RepID=UPI001944513E|nr:winged helix DNA-binding domain-containing protein [Virgisporangium aliadipatigenens]
MEELTARRLNRTLLARQHLLARSTQTAHDLIHHLVAVQAQESNAPYISLWTRLEAFEKDDLTALLADRRAVRSSILRGTQHIATDDDYPWLRPTVQPVLDRGRQGAFGRVTAGVDPVELAALARKHLTGQTLTRPALARLLAERWPDVEPLALGWSAQCLLPVVHPPPSGTWGRFGATPFVLAEEWLGRPMAAPDAERLVVRYLAAFGPGSARDVQAWSGLTRLREVLERLPLRRYRTPAGVVLYDLPDAPLADEDAPAPVRLVPEFDNLLLAHADRTRVIADAHRRVVITGAVVRPTFLVDGFVRGMWSMTGAGIVLAPFEAITEAARDALTREAAELLRFAGTEGSVSFTAPGH